MDQTKLPTVVGFISYSKEEAEVAEKVMGLMLDWVMSQGYDVFVRHPVTTYRDTLFEADEIRFMTSMRCFIEKGNGKMIHLSQPPEGYTRVCSSQDHSPE